MNAARTRVWIALFVTLVFVCGLSLGLAAGLWLGRRADGGPLRGGPRAERWGGPRAFAVERLLDRLAREDPELTDAQRARLETLFAARQEELERVAREMRRRFAAEQRRLRAGAAEILSPAQMEAFDRLRRRPRGGPRPPRSPREP